MIKTGSFTKAAEHLDLCQSAVSRQIINLESDLGFKLFIREGTRFRPTEEGQRMFLLAESMMVATQGTIRAITNKEDSLEGQLTIISSTPIASALLPKYLGELMDLYPKLRLQVRGTIEEVSLEDSDVAIRPYTPNRKDLCQEFLFTIHNKLFASKDYINKFGMPKTPQDLDNHRILTYNQGTQMKYQYTNWILTFGLQSGKFRQPFITFDGSYALLNATKEGLGISQLGGHFPALMGIDLVEVLPDYPAPKIDMFFVYPKTQEKSVKIKALLKFLQSKIGEAKS